MRTTFIQKYFQAIHFLDQLKRRKKTLLALVVLDAILAVASNIVDWDWLMKVPRPLILFAPICSLYPLLLVIWYGLYYFNLPKAQKRLEKSPEQSADFSGLGLVGPEAEKSRGEKTGVFPHGYVPAWFTTFLFMGLVSYGIMSYIYFPAFMAWEGRGVNFHDVASIFWVTAYAFQASVIASELKRLPWYQYALIFGYFFFKDYSDRYLGTFLDIYIDQYPDSLKILSSVSIVSLHVFAAGLVLYLTVRIRKSEGFGSHSTGKMNLRPEEEF